MGDAYDALHEAFHEAFGKKIGESLAGVPAEMGTITVSGLKLDSFKHEIQDYLVAGWSVRLSMPAYTLSGTINSSSGSGAATFNVPAKEIEDVQVDMAAGLQPGDRVLTIPVNGGNDVVVICRVVDNGG
ncbi:hypothetical protein [Paenibacillus sp. P32E]|uniref:hypothetical protein n=1 Tax=Paenibacillus sp. P32E TaxID=1349434 RepID=UPI00093A34D3|nr:hypothetical protein [Paenibacillus sp. P32E]OKP91334.1 hypothetical protein A3848_09505 [Paenibacillus sp. P32E]